MPRHQWADGARAQVERLIVGLIDGRAPSLLREPPYPLDSFWYWPQDACSGCKAVAPQEFPVGHKLRAWHSAKIALTGWTCQLDERAAASNGRCLPVDSRAIKSSS